MKRSIKWEPAALMVLLVLLGFWLVAGTGANRAVHLRPGAIVEEFRIGNTRGSAEVTTAPDGSQRFRLLSRDGFESADLTRAQFESIFGPAITRQVADGKSNPLFRLFNITSWASLVWIAIGFGGQIMFSGRMLIQWLISERHKISIITPAFWWFSLLGGICLFAYFVWRQDAVGVLGQSTGIVIYARNLRLIAKQRRREAKAKSSPLPQLHAEPKPSRAGSLS